MSTIGDREMEARRYAAEGLPVPPLFCKALIDALDEARREREALLEAAKLNMCHWPRCDHTAHVILKQAIERAGG